MATTTNFGWTTPDDTDLVKDGAAAIRTLGSAIDTSLVDLKGGTTGQVLSKTSNTDMDFTWVAQDDSNAIQNAIVDAKGDLIVGTAADTPARLAVGTDGHTLVADSATATGLKWAAAPSPSYTFTTYTPTWNNLTVGNGTNSGAYVEIGNLVYGWARLIFGSTTSISGNIYLTAPVNTNNTPSGGQVGLIRMLDSGVGNFMGIATVGSATDIGLQSLNASGTYLTDGNINASTPFTWTTSDEIRVTFTYQKA